MSTIFELKEQAVTATPLLVFDCELWNGQVERWSTHQVSVDGATYEARVLRHNLLEIQTASDQGVDAIPRVALTLANVDSHFSQLERDAGFKGARITARFVFFDLSGGAAATASAVLFRGIANPPEEITESGFRLTAVNRMNLQRVLLPEVRIQRRCPWQFPGSLAQREEAVDGGARGAYSRFYRCGYSADVTGGAGSLNGAAAYEECAKTRAACQARGMFSGPRRFGGIEFVPPGILVRSHGVKNWHVSAVAANEARYNDFVPLVYGTAWYAPPVVFSRNDGNLTRMEVLLGAGEMEGVLKVLVKEIEVPPGQAGADMTATGWYNIVSLGARDGQFNPDFPGGDPYGSMAYLSVVVPNRIHDGRSLPQLQVLAQGLKLPRYAADGSPLGAAFSANPAWVVLDVLRRCGWAPEEMDPGSFATAAAVCDEPVAAQDVYGNQVQVPRFQCNLVLDKRRSAGDVIRGVRNAARLLLSYGAGGLLELRVENTLALQHPVKPEWSNAAQMLAGGWPSYEFDEGSILRRENEEPSVRMWSRSTADSPNRFAVEFQDALNEYQQDSLSLVDADDVARAGQEITAPVAVLGIPHYNQAARLLRFHLEKSLRGNTYIELETSVKAYGLRPGDLIAVTYLKEGFNRQPFRVLRIAPGMNYETAAITAQIHDDAWYGDEGGEGAGGRRQPDSGLALPRPLMGSITDANGDVQFEIEEVEREAADGGTTLDVRVHFLAPAAPEPGGPDIPLLSLAATIGAGGTLAGGQTLYYAVSAVDAEARESALSFVVRAAIPPGGNTNSVTLADLRFGPGVAGFHVYRGETPVALYRVASDQAPAAQFTDTGLARLPVPAPDAAFDHANFYWRLELQPEYAAALHTAESVGNSALTMTPDQYRGMVARITRGKGAGQERAVVSNSATTLYLGAAWSVEPDATSWFVVAEPGWHFAADTKTSPVEFEIPNRSGAVVHISGRAANAAGAESAAELAPVTRWSIGGAPGMDADVPPAPLFGLGLPAGGGGAVEVSGVAFQDLANTRTIAAGTLRLYFWNELAGAPTVALAQAVDADDDLLDLSAAGAAQAGGFLQIEAEVLRVEEVLLNGTRYRVSRGAHGSTAAAHAAQAAVYELEELVSIIPFARDFFGSPFSGNWSQAIALVDARVASAELFVTNAKGNSPATAVCLTQTTDYGLRTLAGGQFSIQVEGYLAVDAAAAPDLVVQTARSARDVFAVVKQAPVGGPIGLSLKQDGAAYCSLSIPSGGTVSNSVNGLGLPPLAAGARLSLAVTSVGTSEPGADLTVVVRL